LILKDLEMSIPKGTFNVILGDIGSGKSSLLNALLGEMNYQSHNPPKLKINGSVSVVGDKAWILNKTIKENIVLDLPFDDVKYYNAIKYSCMTKDLEIFQKGDDTMIGEKGVTLSGG